MRIGIAGILTLIGVPFSSSSWAQVTTHVPLNYNFNGIVHAGENGLPDDLVGFRSISDRGLDFTLGIPNDPVLNTYQLVSTPGLLDIVHLGNRNTVDGGNHAFDLTPDGDNVGVQPAWLPNVDQSGPQVTPINNPVVIDASTTASFIYQISNGGGAFDVTFRFLSGNSFMATLTGGDWFGGTYPGADSVDAANLPANNLSITEGVIRLGANAGESVVAIEFSNRSNTNAGYAILAAKFDSNPTQTRTFQIPLTYNFNGIVHAGEAGLPDDPVGYRSISDRGLDFSAGVPNQALLVPYRLVSTPGALDIVHLGNRNTVAGGNHAFDPTPDGDNVGIQPTWLTNVDQTGPQSTVLARPITLNAGSNAAFLYQISNGGGSFDVTFTFLSGGTHTATITGGDWFGGTFTGTGQVDSAQPDNNLSITERIVDLSSQAGQVLTQIAFSNRSNANAGYAILAANVDGCGYCGQPGGVTNLGFGNGPTISSSSVGTLGCDLDATVAGLIPNTPGLMLLGIQSVPIPLSAIFAPCTGTLIVGNPVVQVSAGSNANGTYTISLPGDPNPIYCGATIYFQYVELNVGPPCPLDLSDALSITIGD